MNTKADRPVVGLTMSIDPGRRIRQGSEYIYLKRTYPRCVSQSGGHPILITPDLSPNAALELCDALVISGGDDLPSTFTGGQLLLAPTAELSERIDWERSLIDLFSEERKPILGVCYGLQLLNLHFGGTLHEDIYQAIPNLNDHGSAAAPTTHYIETVPGTLLRDTLGITCLVSSSHHQAISNVAPGFTVAARSDDGLVEAIEAEGIIAVEWHPETDTTGSAIYRKLISLAK